MSQPCRSLELTPQRIRVAQPTVLDGVGDDDRVDGRQQSQQVCDRSSRPKAAQSSRSEAEDVARVQLGRAGAVGPGGQRMDCAGAAILQGENRA